MGCVPPVPLLHTVGAVSFVAHLQSLRTNADPVSGSTQSLVFNRGKNKDRSYKLKISTKVI